MKDEGVEGRCREAKVEGKTYYPRDATYAQRSGTGLRGLSGTGTEESNPASGLSGLLAMFSDEAVDAVA